MSEFASRESIALLLALHRYNKNRPRRVSPGRPSKEVRVFTPGYTVRPHLDRIARLRSVNDQSLRRLGIRT